MIRLAVVTAVLLLAAPAWAEPLPVRKIGQCLWKIASEGFD